MRLSGVLNLCQPMPSALRRSRPSRAGDWWSKERDLDEPLVVNGTMTCAAPNLSLENIVRDGSQGRTEEIASFPITVKSRTEFPFLLSGAFLTPSMERKSTPYYCRHEGRSRRALQPRFPEPTSCDRQHPEHPGGRENGTSVRWPRLSGNVRPNVQIGNRRYGALSSVRVCGLNYQRALDRVLQNDFAARMQWTIKPYREANHRPAVVLAENTPEFEGRTG
jgi:hypothetical protein